MVGNSTSVVQAANEYFDALVKSRFIEMFSDVHDTVLFSSVLIDGAGLPYGIVQPGEDGSGTLPIIRSVDIVDGTVDLTKLKHVDAILGQQYKRTELNGNELLITVNGTTGKVLLTDSRMKGMNVTRGIAVARYDVSKVDPYYLREYLRCESSQSYFVQHTKGAALKSITLKDLAKLPVLYPDLELQKMFSLFVKQVDKSKLLFQQMVSKYDELVKSRFIEMFGDPLLNTMNWKTKTLDEITVKIRNGTTPVGAKKVYTEGGVIFLQSQNVWRNKIDYSDTQFISYEHNQKMIDTQLEIGDVLITKTGRINTENSSLGRVSLFRGSSSPVNISSEIYLVRVTKEINSEFLMHLLLMDSYQKYIRTCSPGGTDKRHLYSRYVEKFIIIQPPIELQNQFADFVRQVDKSKSEILEGIKRLKTNRITEQ